MDAYKGEKRHLFLDCSSEVVVVLYDVVVVVFSWRFVAVSMVLLVRTKCWLEIVVVWDVYRTCRGKRWVVYFDGY